MTAANVFSDTDGAGPSRHTLPKGAMMPPRMLIVDHHDSYTHNLLISLLDAIVPLHATPEHRECLARILLDRTLILPHTDPLWQDTKAAQRRLLPHFDALILSPGPGRPEIDADFGASRAILETLCHGEEKDCLPTLGICLGHQGIAVACGAKIKRATHLRHGLSSNIKVVQDAARWPNILMKGQNGESIGPLMTTYNSLVVDEETLSPELAVTAFANDSDIGGGGQSERIVMAIQHRTLPVWGVQFHPESIASQEGSVLIRNFLLSTHNFWRQLAKATGDGAKRACQAKQHLDAWSSGEPLPEWLRIRGKSIANRTCGGNAGEKVGRPAALHVHRKKLGQYPSNEACRAFEMLFQDAPGEAYPSAVWLDSARRGGIHSRWSFMARPSWRLHYNVHQQEITFDVHGEECKTSLDDCRTLPRSDRCMRSMNKVEAPYGLPTPKASRTNSPEMPSADQEVESNGESGFWSWLDSVQRALQEHCAVHKDADGPPFQTGFVGYFGHEMKDESLDSLQAHYQDEDRQDGSFASPFPSAWFAFCDQVLAIDHQTDEWYALGLVREGDSADLHQDERLTDIARCLKKQNGHLGCSTPEFDQWALTVEASLTSMVTSLDERISSDLTTLPSLYPVDDVQEYKMKIEKAREWIAAGQSYELCLTTEFRGTLSDTSSDHFALYKSLRKRNPAPFSAFLRLGERQSILCTSPEKFFSLGAEGETEMKPIKGTMARAGFAKGEQDILARLRAGDEATKRWCDAEDERRKERLFGDAKERAENLMIVDLIRRDLLHFCSPETVVVPSLMGIESYATVHQMVTTVRGKRTNGVGTVMALAKCFPPGSMTGAPKVRSVELLAGLEKNERRAERGVYSGALGWLGVDGAANFNVVIRTVCLDGTNVSVGAGGAITYHSNAEGEWQEVLDKVGALAAVAN